MHRSLLSWFAERARDLPWRVGRTPYRVWIAEVMLQQTRVDTVIPYYRRFLERFPDVETLADAPLERVLKSWEGLGYYRRARYLHAAAGEIVRRGAFPCDAATLRELPGFGPYTAAAVASLAFGERVVAVDGNVRRVAARLFALERPSPRAVARRLEPLQPADRPGAFNEALIELGALVCTPRAPACGACPLSAECRAFAAGSPEAYPDDPPRKPVPLRRRDALLFLDRAADGGFRVWLRRRASDELLPGLWGVPQREAEPAPGLGGDDDAGVASDRGAGGRAGGRAADGEGREDALEPVTHVYSHFRLELAPRRAARPVEGSEPVDAGRLADLPLSNVDRKVLAAARAAGWPVPAASEGAASGTRSR